MNGRPAFSGYAEYQRRAADEVDLASSVFGALADAIEENIGSVEEASRGFLDWSRRVPEPKTGTLDFDRWPFQIEMYTEGAALEEVVVMKGTQVGMSAMFIRWAMYWADRGLTVLYIFPTSKTMLDFCVAGDERVLMADGSTKEIADVVEGDHVMSSTGKEIVPDVVEAAWSSGVRPVLAITLAGGRRMRVTAQHRVWTQRGWVEAGELVVGDRVAVARTLPTPLAPSALGVDDAFLIALWLAEGSKTRAGFTFTNGLSEIRDRAREVAGRRGWDFYEGPRYSVALTANHRLDPATPAALLRRYGLRGMKTDNISVPKEVMTAAVPVAEEFLRTYIACDGYVGPKETTIASASERLIRDLQVLTARLGVPATVRSHRPSYPGGKRCWTLAMGEVEARARLAEIGVPGKLMVGAAIGRDSVSRPGRLAVRADGEGGQGWAAVRSIEEGGEVETFDLRTRDWHAFFLEGGLTHNSDQRVRPLIMGSDYLRRKVPPTSINNKGLRQIGRGFVIFRGSESRDGLESNPADGLVLDEHDLLVQEHIPVAEQRLSASESPMFRRLGVPMIPEHGIAAEYDASDKRRWMVKCASCNEWQDITWEDNVDKLQAIRLCRKCGKSIEDVIAGGQWVAEHPERSVRGYHVSRLIRPRADKMGANLPQIIKASQAKQAYRVENFYRRDLGIPYVHESGRLSNAAIAAAERQYVMQPGYAGAQVVTMGIDVASARDLNVRISLHDFERRTKGALWIGTCETFDDLTDLMNRYDVRMACIDHLPEQRLARAFAERFAGRVYLVRYAGPTAVKVLDLDDEMKVVTVRRTEAIDATLAMVREARNHLPVDRPTDWNQHMKNVVRFTDKDDLDRVTIGYRSYGPDDYLHAETYDLVATECWYIRQEVEETQREVLTPLDEMMEFRRSHLGDADHDDAYSAGRPDTYSPGYEGF